MRLMPPDNETSEDWLTHICAMQGQDELSVCRVSEGSCRDQSCWHPGFKAIKTVRNKILLVISYLVCSTSL